MIRVQAKEQLTCFGKDQQRKIDKIIFRNEKKKLHNKLIMTQLKIKKIVRLRWEWCYVRVVLEAFVNVVSV